MLAEVPVGSSAGPPFAPMKSTIDIRPIRPSDAQLIVAAVSYTSPETYFRRFHGAKSAFGESELRYLTEVDGADHVALVAVERAEQGDRLAAVARYIRSPTDPSEAEFAVCVHDPFHRSGLGRKLLRKCARRAAERGISRFRFVVQPDNTQMLSLMHAEFPCSWLDRRGPGEVEYLAEIDHNRAANNCENRAPVRRALREPLGVALSLTAKLGRDIR